MDELDKALAHRLRAALEAAGTRREDLARQMTGLGFRWTGNTVTQVITERRTLSLLEVAGICEVLGSPLSDLLPPDGFALPSGSVGRDDLIDALTRGASAWRTHRDGNLTPEEQEIYEQFFPPEHDEVTLKVARRLGVDALTAMDAASAMWGRSIGEERDRRATAREGESGRALQARRGHATRALVEEMRAHLAEDDQRE